MFKDFNQEYKTIQQTVHTELEELDKRFDAYFSSKTSGDKKNQIVPIIKEFFSLKGKRIRSLMIFLTAKALNAPVGEFHYNLAMSDELIHNATLIHDDIIDCSLYRRGKKTLNFDYDSKLAVLAGDYLLCEVMNILSSFTDERIRNIHSYAMSQMIKGELHQYFNRFKINTIDDYIEKSKDKTARLFEAGIVSCGYYHGLSKDNIDILSKFALDFGTAFQIQNDLENFENPEKINEDIENGDFSAPIIYYAQEKYGDNVSSLINTKQVLKQLKSTSAQEKTKELAKSYVNSAIENLSFLEDNQYKEAMINLCRLYAQ